MRRVAGFARPAAAVATDHSMQRHALDPKVFIRSMGARGHLGGLSLATREAIRLLGRNQADRERLQGPRDAETMATRDRLAAASLAAGKVKDAISHYKRVLADREKVLGSGSFDTLAGIGPRLERGAVIRAGV